MIYQIDKRMDNQSKEILENLVGQFLLNIWVRGMPRDSKIIEGMELFEIVFETEKERAKIFGKVENEIDGDEYVKFEIERDAEIDYAEYIPIKIENILAEAFILSDEVSWRKCENQWRVVSDVALLLIINGKKILLVAEDSLAGFVEMWRNEADIKKKIEDEESVWTAFKTDRIDEIHRIYTKLMGNDNS